MPCARAHPPVLRERAGGGAGAITPFRFCRRLSARARAHPSASAPEHAHAHAQVVMDVAGVLITCAVCRTVIPVVAGLYAAAPP